jgi:hypothetical protein
MHRFGKRLRENVVALKIKAITKAIFENVNEGVSHR